jgi:predicted GNAT superfamily acetyltransferase
VVRPCKGLEEFQACVALQKEVWKFEDADLVPLRMFVVADKIGGQVIGAFAAESLVGYAFSVPGTRNGSAYLHSHMLAVSEAYRNSGLGQRLKMAQRDDALARGIELIEWTFDPLEIKNAYLNIVKLGAIARRYSVNHYGFSSSVLHRGLPTDRLVAEWWVRSRRVTELHGEGKAPQADVEKTIQVPGKIYEWRVSEADLEKAAEVQKRNREEFLKAFSQGLAVLGFERDGNGNGTFLLGRWDENWSYASEGPE